MDEGDQYQRTLRRRWASTEGTGMPSPWKQSTCAHVGGIHSVGLDPAGDYLLVISHSGRGLIECATGIRVARDYDEDEERWMSRTKLTALGIGPLDGTEVRVAGSFVGGGLPRTTQDGWTVDSAPLTWGNEAVWAEPPGEPKGFYGGGTFYKLWDWDRPFRASCSQIVVVQCPSPR
jgi:hypothetical protein